MKAHRFYGDEPRQGERLRLVIFIPANKMIEPFVCFSRAGEMLCTPMRDGAPLRISCACHAQERSARFVIEYEDSRGFNAEGVLQFENGETISLEKLRKKHSALVATVL